MSLTSLRSTKFPDARVSGYTGTCSTSSYTLSGVSYSVWKFTSGSGSITFSRPGFADILLVGGGAAAGEYQTSGGGAGGYVIERLRQYVEATTYATVVGAGGAVATGNGLDGGETTFIGDVLNFRTGIATGGGSYNTAVKRGMISGGSGHADTNAYAGFCANIGGGISNGCGGGGAGGNASGREGGIGVYSSLETGSPIGYGGGGAQGQNNSTQYGVTTWGGGRSGHNTLAAEDGMTNRGGGGGSRGWTTSYARGAGGSGVVIVRVRS